MDKSGDHYSPHDDNARREAVDAELLEAWFAANSAFPITLWSGCLHAWRSCWAPAQV
jgi:hypothetical protein